MSDSKITTEKRGHLVLIAVNRPAKMNAFDVEMLRQLGDAFGELERDDEARCAVVYANGEHFTAGLDLGNVAPAIARGELALGAGAIDPWGVHGTKRTKPAVIAVHGRCLTLGIELILALDVAVAASNTRFGQIEVKRGIFPFGGATFRLVATAGWGNAMRWLLTGEEFGAEEAHRIGLVQEVVEPGRQLERAIEIAETIAAQAPMGVRATIASARKSLVEAEATAALMDQLRVLMASEDAREGLMSFLERRAARFTGK
ncbi:MAG TPA: crotonase/enoyl-CoA hydratase family protein [Polyangia bacterium]|nr:crotonase/enoyl-CoA hydratase family protein [Polyangia bacterium]